MSAKPLFESSGIFDFLPTPPLSIGTATSKSMGSVRSEGTNDLDVDFDIDMEREEGGIDIEAELAMMEAEEAERSVRALAPSSAVSPKSHGEVEVEEEENGSFISTGLLDFGPVASGPSRLRPTSLPAPC